MKNELEIIYYGFALFIFCMGCTIMFMIFENLAYFENRVADSIYNQHVISCNMYYVGQKS